MVPAYTGCQPVAPGLHLQVNFLSKGLDSNHPPPKITVFPAGHHINILRPDTCLQVCLFLRQTGLLPHALFNRQLHAAMTAVLYHQFSPNHPAGKEVNRRISKETSCKPVGRMGIHILGCGILLHHPFLQQKNPVRYTHSLFLVMGHEYGGDPQLFLQGTYFIPQFNSKSCIQIGKWLVQQKNLRPFYQCSCNRHSLLLPS